MEHQTCCTAIGRGRPITAGRDLITEYLQFAGGLGVAGCKPFAKSENCCSNFTAIDDQDMPWISPPSTAMLCPVM